MKDSTPTQPPLGVPPSQGGRSPQEARFRAIHRAIHADHPACVEDPWLAEPCATEAGPVDRPVVWSRRNGPWRRVDVLWVGAAPGNAGGRGAGDMGAHATRIPFGGDVAGANLDALLSSVGLTRNDTFIVAALNRLPDAGGGEPARAELAEPVGAYPTSLHVLRDTVVAAGPRLVVALGNVGLRTLFAAVALEGRPAWEWGATDDADSASSAGSPPPLRLPGLARLRKAGLERGTAVEWPAKESPSPDVAAAWRRTWGEAPCPAVLWLTHPSAQNMSPWAGEETVFHGRMLEARAALQKAVREVLGREAPAERPPYPTAGIYALPAWRERVGPRHEELDALWRSRGV